MWETHVEVADLLNLGDQLDPCIVQRPLARRPRLALALLLGVEDATCELAHVFAVCADGGKNARTNAPWAPAYLYSSSICIRRLKKAAMSRIRSRPSFACTYTASAWSCVFFSH